MRRGHYIAAISLLIAVFTLTFTSAALADGSPQDICADIQDNGHLDGSYTAEQLAAFMNDPTTQGYCGAIAITVAPTVTPTPANTPASTPATAPPAATPTPAKRVVVKIHKTPTKTHAVKGARHTATARQTAVAPVTRSATPLAVTKSVGSLPFTGAELGLFALVGLALVGTGLLLRTTTRQRL